jgi:benzoate/toluate 1,2-dioxygenase alpha subunit
MNKGEIIGKTRPESAVVDEIREGRFFVDRRIFSDPEIFELEMDRIFKRVWVFLGHESQVKNPGDFITTWIGKVPVVVNRKPSGEIGALVNSCAHRGAMVTRAAKGNSAAFACPYHGWCYDLDGKNIKVPDREGGNYPPAFDTENHDLVPVAKVASYRGFIWGSLNQAAEDLPAYLGQARPIIDLLVDQSPQGLEVLRGSSTYTFQGNWKLQMENGIDGYHFPVVHAAYVMLARRRAESGKAAMMDVRNLQKMQTGCYDLGAGHAMIWGDLPNPDWRPHYNQREELVGRYGDERFHWMMERMRNLMVFPNVQIMDQASTQIRIFRPIAPNKTEIKIYCIAPVGESRESRALRLRQYEDFFNASGLGTPDDLAVFEACQIGYQGAFGRYLQPYDRGIGSMIEGADDEARKIALDPVACGINNADEILYHGPYRQWLKLMAENEAAEPNRE